MRLWRIVNAWPWYLRWTVKVCGFSFVILLTLYPKIWLLPTYLDRMRDMNSVLQPDNPGLTGMEREVRAEARLGQSVLDTVEGVVYRHIPYAWDWDNWGVVDYLPTTAEVLAKGREDCDGRAVVAASLLRRMGYEADLVCDLKHVWVSSPEGQLMSPGEGDTSFVATDEGTQVRFSPQLLANFGRGLTFGIAVFPLLRELVIAAALCAVLVQPRSSVPRRIAGCLAILIGLVLLRMAGASVYGFANHPTLVGLGIAAAVCGCLLLAIRARGHRSQSDELESPAANAARPD
jgi:hypothetical protein